MTALRVQVDVPIARVTLLEDRGQIMRRGSVVLGGDTTRLTVAGVSPMIVDKTLSVRAIEGPIRVVDARVKRRTVVRLRGEGDAESLGAERARLEDERDALARRVDEALAECEALASEVAGMDRLALLSLKDLSLDVSYSGQIGDSWREQMDRLSSRERELCDKHVDARRALRRLQDELERLDRRILVVSESATDERADLEIDLAGENGAAGQIRIDYVVPNACWRPWHSATLLEEGRIELATDACVWQRTGEDWTDVELALSTERASLGTEPPRLTTDRVGVMRKSESLVVETREQDIATAGLGGEPRGRTSAELPGIDDGGETVVLSPTGPVTVPADGRPHRIRLGSFTSEVRAQLCAYPEIEASVLFKSTQSNNSDAPLLAGPVDLIRSSGLVGRTSILYVAPGEQFELGWGPEADLRISREVDVLQEKSRMLSSWAERDTRVRLRLSNLGRHKRAVTVTERVPVSEIEKVKIEIDGARTTGRASADEQGFVTWTVELDGYGHDSVELTWKLKRHDAVSGV